MASPALSFQQSRQQDNLKNQSTAPSKSSGSRRVSLVNKRTRSKTSAKALVHHEQSSEAWTPAPMGEISSYKDSWFDKQMISLFVQAMSKVSGKSTEVQGFEAFVDISRKLMQGRTPAQQHQAVGQVLRSLLPSWVGKMLRTILPPSTFTAEFYAHGTTLFSTWLIGPSKVVEIEVNGVKQNSGVHVQKCRFLESSKCVGMCTNLCKVPSQTFMASELGIPMTMVPNFEDMSCEFRWGQTPAPPEEDPAFQQPCYHGLCPTAKTKLGNCPKIESRS